MCMTECLSGLPGVYSIIADLDIDAMLPNTTNLVAYMLQYICEHRLLGLPRGDKGYLSMIIQVCTFVNNGNAGSPNNTISKWPSICVYYNAFGYSVLENVYRTVRRVCGLLLSDGGILLLTLECVYSVEEPSH